MDDVVGLSVGLGSSENETQLVEGRRTEHVELVVRLRLLAQPLDQPAGYGAERHIIAGPRPADHQEDADRPRAGTGHLGLLGGLRMGTDERRGAEGQGNIGLGVADQFPGDGCRPFDRGDDLDMCVGEIVSKLGPQTTASS